METRNTFFHSSTSIHFRDHHWITFADFLSKDTRQIVMHLEEQSVENILANDRKKPTIVSNFYYYGLNLIYSHQNESI